MSELGTLEKLVNGIAHSRREAISLGDDLLVYLLNMAVLHLRRRSSAVCEGDRKSSAPPDSSSLTSARVYYFPSRSA
jgi:hypothetical protein